MFHVAFSLFVHGVLLTAVCADEKPIFSGPQPGEKLPSLKVILAYGPDRGKTVDLVKQSGGRPTILVIVNGANRPAARLTRALMNFAEMRSDKLHAAVTWLNGDQSKGEQYLTRAISWWGVKAPVGISVDGAEGPGSYGLNRGVNVTILVANKNRVTANFALVQPSPTDAAKILNEVTKLIGGRTPGTAEIVFLSKPTRKLKTAKFKIAPTDVMLRRLICRVLAARNRAEVQKAAREVAKYVDKNAARRAALTDTAIMLLQRPGELSKSPAIPLIRRWRGK